jgi:hypothetical protein
MCVRCGVEFRPVRNDVYVIDLDAGGQESQIWNADLWQCPRCKAEIVSGFGALPMAEAFEKGRFDRFRQEANQRKELYICGQMVERFMGLKARIAAEEALIKEFKSEANELEEVLLEQFSQAGVQNMRKDGRTIFIQRSLQASHLNGMEALVWAFRESGLDDLVKESIAPSTLSAYVREQIKAIEVTNKTLSLEEAISLALPDLVVANIKVAEIFDLRIRSN